MLTLCLLQTYYVKVPAEETESPKAFVFLFGFGQAGYEAAEALPPLPYPLGAAPLSFWRLRADHFACSTTNAWADSVRRASPGVRHRQDREREPTHSRTPCWSLDERESREGCEEARTALIHRFPQFGLPKLMQMVDPEALEEAARTQSEMHSKMAVSALASRPALSTIKLTLSRRCSLSRTSAAPNPSPSTSQAVQPQVSPTHPLRHQRNRRERERRRGSSGCCYACV